MKNNKQCICGDSDSMHIDGTEQCAICECREFLEPEEELSASESRMERSDEVSRENAEAIN